MDSEIQGKLVKTVTAWGAIGITSWAEAASFFACLYTIALLCEWLWKKAIRPMLVNRGYLIADRRKEDHDE